MVGMKANGLGMMSVSSYWLRLVQNKRGEMATPKMIAGNIEAAFKRNPSLMKQLYDGDEISMMNKFQECNARS